MSEIVGTRSMEVRTMGNFLKIASPALLLLYLAVGFGPRVSDDEGDYVAMTYFSGVGCLGCATASPMVLGQLPKEHPNLVVIDYEIYGRRVPDIYQWKEKNIKKLHLTDGAMVLGLDIFMLLESLKVMNTELFFS
jgi:hypothetical protein